MPLRNFARLLNHVQAAEFHGGSLTMAHRGFGPPTVENRSGTWCMGAATRFEKTMMVDRAGRYQPEREAFGRWLLVQKDRGDWVDDLATAARADRGFPKDGDPEAVRAHLRAQQVDGDVFHAVDDAELDWLSL
jgi:hypothetical protein